MVTPYDFIQIIADDEWGLVGIIPPNEAGDKFKRMINISEQKFEQSDSLPDEKVNRTSPKEHKSLGVIREAKIINSKRRAIIQDKSNEEIPTRHESKLDSLITPRDAQSELLNLEKKDGNRNNLNSLSELNETLSDSNNYLMLDSGFGAINRLSTSRARLTDNLLVGFGR